MIALRINKQATKAPPVVNRRRYRLLSGRDCVCNTVNPKDYDLATWRALRVLIVDHQQDRADRLFDRVEEWGHAAQLAH